MNPRPLTNLEDSIAGLVMGAAIVAVLTANQPTKPEVIRTIATQTADCLTHWGLAVGKYKCLEQLDENLAEGRR